MGVDINKNPAWFRTASACKYCGLPVSHPEIYFSKHPGTNYFVDVAKLGEEIILIKGSGDVRSYEMLEALQFMDEYVAKYFDSDPCLFLIENYADIGRVDYKARKLYIDHYKQSNVFWGGIFYKMPRLMQFSFKVAQRLHIQDNKVHAVDTYKQAIFLAQEVISQRNTEHSMQNDNGFVFQSLPGKKQLSAERNSNRPAGVFTKFKKKFFRRDNEKIIQEYSETLLKYIESIDWHKDGMTVPEVADVDENVKKVFAAISYIKSEIDDLLQDQDASEKVLRESEARYRQLVEHAKAGIIEFDYHTTRITSVNESFLSISGYSKEEVFSMDPLAFMSEESGEIFLERLSQRMDGKILSADSAYEFMTKSGQKKWVLLNSNIIYKGRQPQKADIVAIDITHLKEAENKLVRYQSKLKQLAIALSKTEEEQRRQLASTLHEGVSQELFVAQLKLDSLEKSINAPEHLHRFDEVRSQIVKSIREIKAVTYDLSPPVLYELGLKEAVESLVKSFEAKYHTPVKARFSGGFEALNDEIKIIVYRVLKEIMHNAVKHARADFIDVVINNKENRLFIDVIDNGIGFDVKVLKEGNYSENGFGLFDIREKMEHLGGDLALHSTPGNGTRIGLSIPLDGLPSVTLEN